MKQIVISVLSLIVFSALCVYAVETNKYSKAFIVRLMQCIPYSEQQTITDGTGTIQINRRVRGWKEHKCRYFETITADDKVENYACTFSRDQVNELVSAMRNDPNGESTAEIMWQKYKKITDVCNTSNAAVY